MHYLPENGIHELLNKSWITMSSKHFLSKSLQPFLKKKQQLQPFTNREFDTGVKTGMGSIRTSLGFFYYVPQRSLSNFRCALFNYFL